MGFDTETLRKHIKIMHGEMEAHQLAINELRKRICEYEKLIAVENATRLNGVPS